MILFALGSSSEFGATVSRALGVPPAPHEERLFEDGEHKCRPLASVRGRDVFVVQSLYGETGESGNDKLCRLLFFIGALKDAAAARVTALVPYLCYSRKDRKSKPRDPVTTRYVATLFEAVGTDRVVTLDVHNLAAYQNAFRCRCENLEAAPAVGPRHRGKPAAPRQQRPPGAAGGERMGAGGPGVRVFGERGAPPQPGLLTGNGAVFIGTKGIMATCNRGEGVWLLPSSRWKEYVLPPQLLTRSPGHMLDWIRACKGGEPACSNFGVAGPFAEWVTLGASEVNLGFTGGNNRLIREALASSDPPEYFLLLNSDTRVEPRALSALVELLDGHPRAGIAGSTLLSPAGEVQASPWQVTDGRRTVEVPV